MCRYLIPERGGIRIGRGGEGRGGMGRDGKEGGMSSTASGVKKCIWYTDSCWFVCQIDRYRGRWRREISSSRTLAAPVRM